MAWKRPITCSMNVIKANLCTKRPHHLALLASLLVPASALACKCETPATAAMLQGSEIAFAGYIVSAESEFSKAPTTENAKAPRSSSQYGWPDQIRATFHVEEAFKGTEAGKMESIIVPTSNCGFEVTIASPYIILANAQRRTSICYGSHALKSYDVGADEFVQKLRKHANGISKEE